MAIVRGGDPIPLSCQLFDGATNKYIQATVLDPDGIAITGSPVTLTHQGGGKYTDDSLTMPTDKDFVDATFKVYDDAALTVLSDQHSDSTEIYQLAVPVAELIEVLDKIKEILENGVIARGIFSDLVAHVDDDSIVAHITEEDEIVVQIPDDNTIVAEVVEPEDVVATVETDEIVAIVPCT